VAPKIPPPNTTLTLTHPIAGTQLTITYVSYGTDMPVCVQVNGTQIPTAVIPTQYLQKSLSVRVVTATKTMKAVIKSVQGGNLTYAYWEGGERVGRLVFRVEAPSGAWIYAFVVSSGRPTSVAIGGAPAVCFGLDELLSQPVEGWSWDGVNTVVVKARARSPVNVILDYAGTETLEWMGSAVAQAANAAVVLAAAFAVIAAVMLLKVLAGGSFDPVDFAKTVLVVLLTVGVAAFAVQVIFHFAAP
jgi:hypothetical protein